MTVAKFFYLLPFCHCIVCLLGEERVDGRAFYFYGIYLFYLILSIQWKKVPSDLYSLGIQRKGLYKSSDRASKRYNQLQRSIERKLFWIQLSTVLVLAYGTLFDYNGRLLLFNDVLFFVLFRRVLHGTNRLRDVYNRICHSETYRNQYEEKADDQDWDSDDDDDVEGPTTTSSLVSRWRKMTIVEFRRWFFQYPIGLYTFCRDRWPRQVHATTATTTTRVKPKRRPKRHGPKRD